MRHRKEDPVLAMVTSGQFFPRYQCPLLSCFLSVPPSQVPKWTQTAFFAFDANRNYQIANWHACPAEFFDV